MLPLLDKYHRDIHTALSGLLERTRQQQTNIPNRKSFGSGSSFTPGATCEEIALYAVELSSRARTLEEAINVVNDSYRALFQTERD